MAKGKKSKRLISDKAIDSLAEKIARKLPTEKPKKPAKPSAEAPKIVHEGLAEQASMFLAIAACIGIALGISMFALEGGQQGVPAIGGVLDAQIPVQSAKIILLLDILYPVFFGAGFAVLATALQTRGNRPLIRLIMTTILVALVADFLENALVYSTLTGEGPYMLRWPLTVVKYAGLAFGAVMFSAILPITGNIGKVAHFVLRYFFPFAIAFLLSGLGGLSGANIVAATFPLSLVLMADYSRRLAKDS